MIRLWLVRHGPTHQKTMTGWRDVPADLSDAAALDRMAQALPVVPVVSSDLARATATADRIAAGRPRLADEPGLREIDFGDWDGRSFEDISRTDPVLSRTFWERPGEVSAPNGESWNRLADRVGAVLDRLTEIHPNLIVVAHMGAILSLFPRAGGSAYEALGHRIDPLGTSLLTKDGSGWRLRVVNCPPDRLSERIDRLDTDRLG